MRYFVIPALLAALALTGCEKKVDVPTGTHAAVNPGDVSSGGGVIGSSPAPTTSAHK